MTSSSRLWRASMQRLAPSARQRLFALTVATGGVCGLAAVAFHVTIHAVERHGIDRAFAAPGRSWIAWVIAVPTMGALIAGIVLAAVPNARGSGIPQVKAVYALGSGRIALRDAFAKFLLASLQLGTGSSLGREGPTVQICAGAATSMGRLARVSAQHLRMLLPVGAAAGIAAAFNAPLSAVTFTIEEVIGTLDPTMLSGAVVAAAFAAVVEHGFLGAAPILTLPAGYQLGQTSSLLFYGLLGIAAGVASLAFSSALLGLRAWCARWSRVPVWGRPAVGGLVAGTLAVAAMLLVHTRGIDGGGYGVLVDGLGGGLAVQAMLVLGVFKLVATVWSYATGGAGGLFAPSLFVGAMVGGLVGVLDVTALGEPSSTIGAFAVVGMGAVFAGTVRAPITSILIIVEMTGGYALVLPLMLANVTAYALARHVQPLPIYDALLVQDGVDLRHGPSGGGGETMPIPLPRPEPGTTRRFALDDGAAHLVSAIEATGRQEVFPVTDGGGRLLGLITLAELTELAADPDVGDLVRAVDVMRAPISVGQGDSAGRALELMHEHNLRQLPLVDEAGMVIGLVDEVAIARAYLQARRRARTLDAAAGPAAAPTAPS